MSDTGAAVSGATVAAPWKSPAGSETPVTAVTESTGRVRLLTSGGRGTYTLTVSGVTKTGTFFDGANRVLTWSIIR